MGNQLPLTERGIAAPTLQPVGWIQMPLGTDVGLGKGDIVLGPSTPMQMGTVRLCGLRHIPASGLEVVYLRFWATVCKTVRPMLSDRCPVCLSCLSCLSVTLVHCGQTVGQIQMKLGTRVGLGPGHIVLDGEPAPKKGHSPPPTFGPCLLWPNGWMDQDATCYKGRPRPRPHCVASGPSSPFQKGHSPCPQFRPMYIVAKRSPISATVEYLLPIFPLFQQKYFLLCQNPNTAFQGHRGSRVHCKSDNISETVTV